MFNPSKKFLKPLLILLALLFLLSGCSKKTESKQITCAKDLETATIGIMTGTSFDKFAMDNFPNAKLVYYNSLTDTTQALKTGKIDTFLNDEPLARYASSEDNSVTYLKEKLKDEKYAIALVDTDFGHLLKEQFDAYVDKCKADGSLKELQDYWLNAENLEDKEVDYENLEDLNGTINLALNTQSVPFVYFKDGKYAGYEVDLVTRFAKEYGYKLNIEDTTSYASQIAGISSGKYHMAAACITITPEREKVILFSNPTYEGGIVAVIRNENVTTNTSFLEWVTNSFNSTFIEEDRWKLFVSGIATTLLITILSVVFGTLLGFLLYMLCKDGNKLANTITNICIWIVGMMPIVVLLMILYYLIFGKSRIPAIFVASLGFSLTFGSSVFSMLKVGVGAVPVGQEEAARSMGYTKNQAFYKFVLPQAIRHMLPIYRGEIVTLIKGTAIVGYISVEDITKVSDIIRSRTFEAFFPLIATAIFYAVIIAIIVFFIKKIEVNIDPKKRSVDKILKGVKRDD